MSGKGGEDALVGCAVFITITGFIIAAVLAVLAALSAIYVSVMVGKFFSYITRTIFGWLIESHLHNRRVVKFSMLSALFIVPVSILGISTGIAGYFGGLEAGYITLGILILGLIGYYAAHFGEIPRELSEFSPGVVLLHEQEAIWINSMRTKGLIFWHWTITKHAVAVDDWFKRSIARTWQAMPGVS